MSRSKARAAVVPLLLALLLGLASPAAATDPRCSGGGGIQVWENSGLSGSTTVFCLNSNSQIFVPKLSQVTDGLFFFANWNDRISSFQVFSSSGSQEYCFWHNETYTGTKWSGYGNRTVTYVGDSNNDRYSSLKSTSNC
jgi:hypothetical protein